MTTVLRPDAGFDAESAASWPATAPHRRVDVLGRPVELTWSAVAQGAVALLAAALFLVNLTVSGFANTYYSAAALAASQSWSAWFFGSIDPANFITVDKPPLSTMVMGLSVRLFGLSSWSILVPEALMGVATVVLLMAIVRRTFGSPAAVIAGLVAALTPAAVLIFRFNNPDALLTLLLTAAAYAFVRSLDGGRLRWVAFAALLVGLAFNTKYLQAWLVLPAFAVVWTVAAPGSIAHRVRGLLVAFAGTVLASGWWIAVMELLPTSVRPFVGGSTNGSALDLVLGYDGLGRIFGGSGGPAGGGPGGGGFSGAPGLLRLSNDQLGGQAAWLLPLAFLGLAVGLWARRGAPRTDLRRAAYLLWGLWLVVHVVVFSFMSGIIHSYYVVAMAPAIGALVGGGVTELARMRDARPRNVGAGIVLAAGLVGSAAVAWVLLARTPDFAPGLAIAIAAVTIGVAVVLALPAVILDRRIQVAALVIAVGTLLAAPAAYAVQTVQSAYGGGDPSAGPAVANAGGPGSFGGRQGAAFGGGGAPGAPTGGGGFGAGGPGDAVTSSALTDYLAANQGSARWIVAVSSANQAGSIELATGLPVMAMGGFSGGDPTPTLEQLQAYVASGDLRFVIVGGGGGPGAGSSDVSSWVTSSCAAVTSVTSSLYDCAGVATGG
ncbi:MAG TPA: glycosyltransferase family 39 protein [Candidatus Limnocylindrales bacterium]